MTSAITLSRPNGNRTNGRALIRKCTPYVNTVGPESTSRFVTSKCCQSSCHLLTLRPRLIFSRVSAYRLWKKLVHFTRPVTARAAYIISGTSGAQTCSQFLVRWAVFAVASLLHSCLRSIWIRKDPILLEKDVSSRNSLQDLGRVAGLYVLWLSFITPHIMR
jgi:hypothetical protein